MELPQPCGCDHPNGWHRTGCLVGPQWAIPKRVEAIDSEENFFLLRSMTEGEIHERVELNRAVTSESIRARALAGRASLNGHVLV